MTLFSKILLGALTAFAFIGILYISLFELRRAHSAISPFGTLLLYSKGLAIAQTFSRRLEMDKPVSRRLEIKGNV